MRKSVPGEPLDICGEVFELDGKVACAIPPIGKPGSIPFQAKWVYPETDQFPSWVNITVDGKACRILADIVQPPCWRLADCVALIAQRRSDLPFGDQQVVAEFAGSKYVFWRVMLGGSVEVVMATTMESFLKYNPQG